MTASKIEWCDRSDWNPIRGCTRVSPGCGGPGPHGGCYAEALAARFSDPGMWGHGFAERTASGPRWTGTVELQQDRLDLPLRWKKPARIFVSSTSDVFHEKLPDEAIDRVFAVMALAPQHTFQVLTKRAQRMRDYSRRKDRFPIVEALVRLVDHPDPDRDTSIKFLATKRVSKWPLPNVWLGVSAEDQARADERIPLLLDTPAAKHFVSLEPLLGPIDLTFLAPPDGDKPRFLRPDRLNALTGSRGENGTYYTPVGSGRLDWVIVGGESGPGARPMDPVWARTLRDQCVAAGVAFHFKQWGQWHPDALRYNTLDGLSPPPNMKIGKKAAGRSLDGREWNEFPA